MLLGGVFRGIGAGDGPMATLSAQKAAHNHADMHRWAARIPARELGEPAGAHHQGQWRRGQRGVQLDVRRHGDKQRQLGDEHVVARCEAGERECAFTSGQGAVGIEVREHDERMATICERLNHFNTLQCVTAERAFLAAMGGGCQSPVAAYAQVVGKQIRMRALSFTSGPMRHAEGKTYLKEPVKLGQQLAYADRRGFRVAIIAGKREFDAGTCQVKDLASAQSRDVPLNPPLELIAAVQRLLT